MFHKSFGIMFLISMLVVLDLGSIDNLNLTGMQAIASYCKYLGQITKIQDGSVERKRPGGQWQKITSNTKLCQGDILKTISNRGKKISVKVKCNAPESREKSLSADQITGVTNVCLPSFADFPGRRQGAGTR